MLNRLGLVVHWLGFTASCSILIWGLIEDGTHFRGCFDIATEKTVYFVNGCYFIDIEVIRSSLGGAAFFLLTTWGIRFILTSHKSLLPWVANKGATDA